MAVNLSALSQGANLAKTLGNLILVSPQKTSGYQPQNAPSWEKNTAAQPPAILFNYEGEQVASLTSDITDHYVENNTPIQDQIALKPEKFRTGGFVGELNDIAPAALEALKIAADKLTIVSGFVPGLSTTALLAYANALALYQAGASLVNSAVGTWASINGGGGQSVINGGGLISQPNQSRQQIYFQQFYGYWKSRTLFTVQTPWAVFQDMAIENLEAVQDAETRVITDFTITFKLMRFASTQLATDELYSDNSNMQGRAKTAGARTVDLGTSALETSSVPFTSALPG